jgi:hypothetical protein
MWPGGGIIEHLGSREHYSLNYWFDEGCSVCDWLGLNLDLWCYTQHSRYLDMAERVALNHLMFSQDAEGGFCGDRSVDFVREGEPWPYCCAMHGTRTLAELTGYIGLSDGNQVWIGLFYPATVSLTVFGEPVVMDIETAYPQTGKVTLTMRQAGDWEFPLRVRVPGWSRIRKLAINGRLMAGSSEAGYSVVKRRWANGDRVLIEFELPLRQEARRHFIGDPVGTDYSTVSLWCGPQQLVFNQQLNNHLWKLRPARPALRYIYQTYGELQRDKSVQGNNLRIGKKEYSKGLGVHAVSEMVFYLGGQFKEFRSDIGIDSSARGDGAVRFRVCVDGAVKPVDRLRIFADEKGKDEVVDKVSLSLMTGKDDPRSIRVDVQGAQEIRLVVDEALRGLKDDYADWADARLISADNQVVYLSDLPDERTLGLPCDWLDINVEQLKNETLDGGPILLSAKVDGKTVPVYFNCLSDLGTELIQHRPVLVSWLHAAPER